MGSTTQRLAVGLVVVAVVPYATLKVLWLGGSTAGLRSSDAAAEMASSRMVVGNVITIALELLALGLAVALVQPWGRRLPAWPVLGLAAGATGCLAPILLGLPLGSVLQVLATGGLRTGGMGDMSPWVFAIAYGGFGLIAVGIAVLLWCYAVDRWGAVIEAPPRRPARWALAVGTLGLVPFGVLLVAWGLLGPGESGPQGMVAVSQRTVLVVSGLLVFAGWAAPLARGVVAGRPRAAWLVTWTGCTTAAMQGLAQVLLANQGDPSVPLVTLALVSVPGGAAYGLAVLRRRLAEVGPVPTSGEPVPSLG